MGNKAGGYIFVGTRQWATIRDKVLLTAIMRACCGRLVLHFGRSSTWLALVGDISQFVWNRHSHLWGSRGVRLWRKTKTTGALENMSVGVPNGSGRHHAV